MGGAPGGLPSFHEQPRTFLDIIYSNKENNSLTLKRLGGVNVMPPPPPPHPPMWFFCDS